MERLNLEDAMKVANKISARLTEKALKPKDRLVSCPYCNDGLYLILQVDWIINGFIPHDAPLFLPGITGIETTQAIACDCCPEEQVSKGSKKVKKFKHVFGVALKDHYYGKKIMEQRYKQSEELDLPGF